MSSAADRLASPPPERKNVVYDASRMVLNVEGSSKYDLDVADSLTGASLSLTVEGASTLTLSIEDPGLNLLNGGTLARWAWGETGLHDEHHWIRKGNAVSIHLDDIWLRLVKASKQAPTSLTLTSEDRIVNELRRHHGAKSANRSHVTRAEFVKMLADQVKAHGGIEVFIPELHKKQKIAKSTQKLFKGDRRKDGHKGLAEDSGLTGRDGHELTPGELRNAERVCDVAESQGAPKRAFIALLEACIVEAPNFDNPTGGDSSSVGILQLLDIHLGGSVSTNGGRRDIEKVCALFLTDGFSGKGGAIQLAQDFPSWTPGQIAQAVQGSAHPDRYEQQREPAEAIYNAYNGGGGRISTESFSKAYHFARGKHENSWDAIQRLAQEVNWRAFVREGRLWYASEEWLFQQRAELVLREGEGGCDAVDFDIDFGARDLVAEVTVTARANLWTALPGMVIVLKGQGPADGRWLVSQVDLDLLDKAGTCTVTLRKPIPPTLEPAPELGTRTVGGGSLGDTASGVAAVLSKAQSISAKGYPYVWGGGHQTAGVPSGGGVTVDPRSGLPHGSGTPGYDCSGYTAACLLAGDMLPESWKSGVPVSGTFASSWGKPGKGKHMTVWANAEHVWIEFHDRNLRADTSPWGSGPSGPHVRPMNRSTAGFTPRHFPDT